MPQLNVLEQVETLAASELLAGDEALVAYAVRAAQQLWLHGGVLRRTLLVTWTPAPGFPDAKRHPRLHLCDETPFAEMQVLSRQGCSFVWAGHPPHKQASEAARSILLVLRTSLGAQSWLLPVGDGPRRWVGGLMRFEQGRLVSERRFEAVEPQRRAA